MKYVRELAAALVMAGALGGCGSSRPPIGLEVYEGSHATSDITMAGLKIDSDTINTRSRGHVAAAREQVRVYVSGVELGESKWEGSQLFKADQLRKELQQGLERALTSFGRFEVVRSETEAEYTARVSMDTIAPWGDWFFGTEHVAAKLDSKWNGKATAQEIQDWMREGVDMPVTITLGYANRGGAYFASGQATAQLISRHGGVFQTASGSGISSGTDLGSMAWSKGVSVENTKIREEQLPQIISEATKGAMIMLHDRLDATLWAPADKNGWRAKANGAASTHATGASIR